MTTLSCPRCGRDIIDHANMLASVYICKLTAHEATRLAQRRKAAERFREIFNPDPKYYATDLCQGYLQALHDTGILGENESEAELLKEMEGETK